MMVRVGDCSWCYFCVEPALILGRPGWYGRRVMVKNVDFFIVDNNVNLCWSLFIMRITRSARSVCKAGYCLNEGTCTVAIIAPGIPIIAFIDWMFCQESTSQFVPVLKDSKGLAASSNTCRQPFQARQLHYYHFAKLINISSRLHRCHYCMPFICRSDSDLNLVDHHKVRFP